MKWIRALWAAAFSFLIVTVFAVIISAIVKTNTGWFKSLKLPIMPSSVGFELIWLIIYISLAGLLVKLIVDRRKGTDVPIFLLASEGILQIIWVTVFFRFHLVLISVFVMFGLAAAAIIRTYVIRRDLTAVIIALPYLIWILYLFMLNYTVINLN